MKKYITYFKIPLIIFAVFLVVGIACKVIADNRSETAFVRNNTECTTDERVFDYGEKLTDEEENELRAKISEAELLCGTDIIIVTLDETLEDYAKSYEDSIGYVYPHEYTMVFADNFYDENKFGFNKPYGDGVLLLDNWYREWDGGVYSWMSTSGKAQVQFSSSEIDDVLDSCLNYVEEDPAYAYGYFVDLVAKHLNPNNNLGESLGGGISVLVGLVAGLIFFFVNFGGKKGKKTVETRTYVNGGVPQVRERQDIFITRTTSRRKIETQTRSGGGGHISAGGRSHGGGGHRR